MLMLGGRYGSIEPKSGKSYIELEYEYASEKQMPLFAAVISNPFLEQKVKQNGLEATERINGLLLESFRGKVLQKTSRTFSDPNELKVIVFESLSTFNDLETLSGWIRGDEVV